MKLKSISQVYQIKAEDSSSKHHHKSIIIYHLQLKLPDISMH